MEGLPDSQRTPANEAPPGQRAVTGKGSKVSPDMRNCVWSMCGSKCEDLLKMTWEDIKRECSQDQSVYTQCVVPEMMRGIGVRSEHKTKHNTKPKSLQRPAREPGFGLDNGGGR